MHQIYKKSKCFKTLKLHLTKRSNKKLRNTKKNGKRHKLQKNPSGTEIEDKLTVAYDLQFLKS